MTWISHPDTDEIIRVPGYLFYRPTDMAGEATWGTKLGYCESGIEVEIKYNYRLLSDEEHGEEPIYKIFLGTSTRIIADLKNYSNVVVNRLFRGLCVGGGTKRVVIPNNFLAGEELHDSGTRRLLFVPDDITNNPVVLAQLVCPNIEGSFKFSREKDTVFRCVFDCIRKTDDVDGLLYFGDIAGAVLR